jgi:hypothetical protein
VTVFHRELARLSIRLINGKKLTLDFLD